MVQVASVIERAESTQFWTECPPFNGTPLGESLQPFDGRFLIQPIPPEERNGFEKERSRNGCCEPLSNWAGIVRCPTPAEITGHLKSAHPIR
jgi:hypothetical protein